MPNLPGNPPNNPIPPAPNTVGQVCTDALYEINVVAPGEIPDPVSEMTPTLNKFNQLLDSWSTQAGKIFALDLLSKSPFAPNAAYLLVPNLSPHTIGPPPIGNAPAPTFAVVGERPVRIKNVNVILNNVTPPVRQPLEKWDKDQWATERLQGITTSIPTNFYYRPDWPLGSIFFWPVPNFSFGVEFEIETFLNGSANLATVFAFPPGYELAIRLTLAELLCPMFEKAPHPLLVAAALKARMAVDGLNALPPRINLDDFGGPGTGTRRASFNYHSGMSGS